MDDVDEFALELVSDFVPELVTELVSELVKYPEEFSVVVFAVDSELVKNPEESCELEFSLESKPTSELTAELFEELSAGFFSAGFLPQPAKPRTNVNAKIKAVILFISLLLPSFVFLQ